MTLEELGNLISGGVRAGKDFLQDYGTLVGAAGQIANQNAAVKSYEGMADDAKKMIREDIYPEVSSASSFKPFTVSAAPGSVSTTATGGTTFSLSPEQQAVEKSLRTGGMDLLNAVLGNQTDPVTGEVTQNMRGDQAALINLLNDPFKQENLANTEQTMFDRLQALRAPEQGRAQTALTNQLIGQGRQGLQTSAYGGTPEQLALSKAIEEQKSADAISAMGLARQDAQRISDNRLQALRQQVLEKDLGGRLASQFLDDSYRPTEALLAATQPSINLADIATVAGRQRAGYGTELAKMFLDYDLGNRGAATNIRNQTMEGIFKLLAEQQRAAGNVAAAQAGAGDSSDGNFFQNLFDNYINRYPN